MGKVIPFPADTAPIPIPVRATLSRMNGLCGEPGVPHVQYRQGATVRFRSRNGTSEGTVNGATFKTPEGYLLVPVFVESDTGGSCLFVRASNILLPGE